MPVRPLSSELQEKARAELGEDPQRLQDRIQHLKEWLSKQPHLNARTDDQWLAAFLRGSKFSLERTKEKLDLHHSVRALAPELFQLNHRDPRFIEILRSGTFAIIPKLANPTAPRVFMMRFGHYDPSKISMIEFMSAMSIIAKLHVHKNFEDLYKHVPKEVLPAEYGGNGGTFQEINEAWIEKVKEWGPWLDEDLQYGTDESKRPGKPNTAEDMFGVDGSFRQLQFD